MNKFYLLSCRFHIKEKNKLVIQGYFETTKGAVDWPFFTLDYQMLPCEVVEKTYVRNPLECMEGIYDKRYFFIVDLPANYQQYKELRCFQYDDRTTGESFHLTVAWLKKQQNKREMYIDEAICKDGKFSVRGWCICQKGVEPYLILEKNKRLPVGTVRRVERLDVERACPDAAREDIYGFEIVGEMRKKRSWLIIEDEYGSSQYEVNFQFSGIGANKYQLYNDKKYNGEKLEEMGYFNFDINYKFNEVVL